MKVIIPDVEKESVEINRSTPVKTYPSASMCVCSSFDYLFVLFTYSSNILPKTFKTKSNEDLKAKILIDLKEEKRKKKYKKEV